MGLKQQPNVNLIHDFEKFTEKSSKSIFFSKLDFHSAILLPIKASLERAKYLESDNTPSTSLLTNRSKSSLLKNLASQINLFSPPALTNQSTAIPETQINQYLLNYESILTEAKSCHDQHVSKVQKEIISVWVLKLSLLNDLKTDKSKLENKRLYYDSVRKKSKFSVKRSENDTEDKEIMKSFEDLELYEAKYIQKMKDQVTQESKSQVQSGIKLFLNLENKNRLEINKILEKAFLEQSETSGSNPDDSGIQNTSLTNSQVSFSRDFEDTMPRSQNLNGTVLYSYQAGLDDVLSIENCQKRINTSVCTFLISFLTFLYSIRRKSHNTGQHSTRRLECSLAAKDSTAWLCA